MSRIHEALKKAEQERQMNDHGESALIREQHPEPGLGLQANMAYGGAASASVLSSGEALPHETAFQTLAARCRTQQWNPHAKMLFSGLQDHRPGSEEFRSLRSRLYQLREKQPLTTVLVASALPGEGKTYVAANLAQSIVSQPGRRALLIDADMRKPQLNLLLGASAVPGLSEYLRGEADEFAILQKGGAENLFFVPGGNAVQNPVELISNGRLQVLLQRVRPAFDWIIIDSPPAVPVTDASLLADMCDGVLLVVQAGVPPLEMLQKAREEFRKKPLLGVALNKVDPKATYSKYYYAYYPQTVRDDQ